MSSAEPKSERKEALCRQPTEQRPSTGRRLAFFRTDPSFCI